MWNSNVSFILISNWVSYDGIPDEGFEYYISD